MEEDDFFEYFRNKDLSNVKKFNFKKAKGTASPVKQYSMNEGILNPSNNLGADGYEGEKQAWKRLDEAENKRACKPNTTINNVDSHIKLDTPIKNSKGKFTFKPRDDTKILAAFNAPSRELQSDTYLDALYKNTTGNISPSKPKGAAGSPSLLSSRPKLTFESKFNVSKYFNKDSTNENPKISCRSPFKNFFQAKHIESVSHNAVCVSKGHSETKITVSDSLLGKRKKFEFKKKVPSYPLNNCSDESRCSDLEQLLEDVAENSVSDLVIQTVESERQVVLGPVDKAETKPLLLNGTRSLEVTDADYMDDEEFEQMFGHLAEQTLDNKSDFPSTSKKESPDDDCRNTEELLNEISNINWEENAFQDAPVQDGFKGRDDNSGEFRGQYEHSEVMMEVLHQRFGLRNFRPYQREIINASLTGNDCVVLMPTGGGKSLCYQLPATLMPGVTIVISPLRALISDQVDKLNALDISAAHLCSDVSKRDSDQIYMKLSMREPAIKLLYLTPEKISASRVVIEMLDSLYQRGKLARFVIDEVHCLSQWGHDFRPDYKQLGMLRVNYKQVPIICLTATATKQVENDVINILKLGNVKRFIQSFNRPNIKYEVIEKVGKVTDEIATLVKSKFSKKSGIVYCLSRKDCEALADDFNRLGVKAKPYHAGMADKVREAIQREWMQDRFHVIVATIAFGMGIDKPDVRFVVHNSIPKSVEAFYQESGRAGRDGEISYSYLYYSYRDVGRLQKLMRLDRAMTKKSLEAHDENLKQMVSFAENLVDCRRYLQLLHLGENFDRRLCIQDEATTCDNCRNIDKYRSADITKEAKELCGLVKDLSGKENVTMVHIADVYRGAKIKKILERRHNTHPLYGHGVSMDRNDVHRVLKELIIKHVLQEFHTYTGDFPVVYLKTGPKFYQFYNSNSCLTISMSIDKKRNKQKEPIASVARVEESSAAKPSTSKEVVRHSVQKQNTAKLQAVRKLQLAQIKVQCHEELLEECRRLAMERNLTLSSVMNLSAIKSMSDHLPSTREEMLKIQHVTVANYNKYGEYFLKIAQKFREKHDSLRPLAELQKPDVEERPAGFSDEDFHPATCPPPIRGGGVKRKANWTGRKGGYKKKKYVKKRKGKTSSPKTSSGWKGKGKRGASGGGGLGLMPLHIK